MSISEQVKELREFEIGWLHDVPMAKSIMNQAADTIESLSAKLQAANMECKKGNYSIGDLSELIDKFDNEKIKGITDFEQVQIFNALKYLDMYQKVGTIEKFMELRQNMERSAEDCGGWIPCKERLPTKKESIKNDNRFILDDGNRRYGGLFDYEKQCFVQFDFWKGLVEDKCAIAWQPLPEPYHEP